MMVVHATHTAFQVACTTKQLSDEWRLVQRAAPRLAMATVLAGGDVVCVG